MKKGFLIGILLLLLTGCASISLSRMHTACALNKPLSECPLAKSFVQKTKITPYSASEIMRYLNQIKANPIYAQTEKSAPEVVLTWPDYKKRFITPNKVADGKQFYLDHKTVLTKVAHDSGVDPRIIVATIGIETDYGRNKGKFKVLNALGNLAFYYPRNEQQSLKNQHWLKSLLMVTSKYNLDPTTVLGSYAGAIGQPQFMPDSVLKFAIQYNPNSKAPLDLNNNEDDVIASIANFYKKAGHWKNGQPVAKKMIKPLPKGTYKIAEFGNETWVLYHNFNAIRRYNPSNYYAMAVYLLSKEIGK